MGGEAIAAGIMQLALLTICWVVVVAVALLAPGWKEARRVRSLLAVVAVVSLPAYIANEFRRSAQQELDAQKNHARRVVQADYSSELYHRYCEESKELTVRRTVSQSRPVTIRIRESPRLFGLELMQPIFPHKRVCWVEAGSGGCSQANVAKVQWEFRSQGSWCEGSSAAKDCHLMWEVDVERGLQTNVERIDAPYVIDVSKAERLDPLIERFQLTVRDAATSEVLGETHLYRKSWFGDIGRKPAQANEPRHCPDRDLLVGELLAKIFPKSSS